LIIAGAVLERQHLIQLPIKPGDVVLAGGHYLGTVLVDMAG